MKAIILIALCFSFFISSAQKNQKEYFLFYDRDWKPCRADSTVYFAWVRKLNDSLWQWNYYNNAGPILNIESYKDEKATIPEGYFAYFNDNGKIDSAGYTSNGLKNGKWYYYEDSLSPRLTRIYEMGKLIKEDVTKPRLPADQQLKPGEKEAEFKGGDKAWIKYLLNNLTTPDRALNLHVNGTVNVAFVVNAAGNIEEIQLVKSVEYSADKEAMRMIIESPAWVPAQQDGHAVKAYRRQPITFRSE